ncbi:quinolinate synthase [Candidatus Marinamargulisbacteria bacterium SCGC AG-410-N11]|nr:quinolinate synthase [Candidatus Marinamargulisbacteria bacterium SCGC AG-410-N11]
MTLTAQDLYLKLKNISIGNENCKYSLEKCVSILPIINKINQLKKEKNTLILGHSYVSPEILYGIADKVGDSYELSLAAKNSNADSIIFCAVKFMADTAKILNPNKSVYIPSTFNGCSLADSITLNDIKLLKEKHPNYTFVCYINTTAEIKSECDVCVTSSNATKIIKNISNENIYFLPDKLMGQNIINDLKKQNIKKNIKLWNGTCYVHEEYEPKLINSIKSKDNTVQIISHPECAPNIIEQSDFVGSTSQIVTHVKKSIHNNFFLLTECGLSSRMQSETPSKNFIGSCTMCKYMKANNLQDILTCLESPKVENTIEIDKDIQQKALKCIENMFYYNNL